MLGRLTNPLFGLLSLVALYTAGSVAAGIHDEWPAAEADLIYAFGFTLLLMWWVYVDRHKRRYPAPFEFEAFVFFAWPVVVPAYLIHTRRWRALPLIAALYGAYWFSYLVDLVLYGF